MTTLIGSGGSKLALNQPQTLQPTAQQLKSLKLYNTNRNRRGNPIVFPKNALDDASRNPVRLVPIRLDLEVDGIKIRDSFSWNLNEVLVTPEQFAMLLIEDMHDTSNPSSVQNLVTQIANSIRQQCQSWQNAVHEEEDNVESDHPPSNSDEKEDGIRTLIRLDLQVGNLHLTDQFEWPIMPYCPEITDDRSSKTHPTPESFAAQLCSDLGLGGEFVSIISHSIREQLCFARLNFDEAPKSLQLFEPPFRMASDGDGVEWTPIVEFLSEEEIDRRLKEQERTNRRVRRSQRMTTGNTIVINRGTGFDDGDSDDEGSRRKSRAAASQAQKNIVGQGRFQPYGGAQQKMMGNYAAFSTLPQQYQQAVYAQFANFRPQQGMQGYGANRSVPYRNYKPSPEEEEAILKKLEETINMKSLAPPESPPKRHRGFGASAQRFNSDGSIPVGEFREKWRCSWCLLSGKFTPTLRKGPTGSKTLCNACGIWYGKHGSLPQDRYQEHANSES